MRLGADFPGHAPRATAPTCRGPSARRTGQGSGTQKGGLPSSTVGKLLLPPPQGHRQSPPGTGVRAETTPLDSRAWTVPPWSPPGCQVAREAPGFTAGPAHRDGGPASGPARSPLAVMGCREDPGGESRWPRGTGDRSPGQALSLPVVSRPSLIIRRRRGPRLARGCKPCGLGPHWTHSAPGSAASLRRVTRCTPSFSRPDAVIKRTRVCARRPG